jgi:hypothetical protein
MSHAWEGFSDRPVLRNLICHFKDRSRLFDFAWFMTVVWFPSTLEIKKTLKRQMSRSELLFRSHISIDLGKLSARFPHGPRSLDDTIDC